MERISRRVAEIVGVVAIIVAAGCSGQAKVEVKQATPVVADSTADATLDEHAKGSPLSDEDKALVTAQRLCPVTDEDLMADAEMGGPVKLTVKGETVFICCKGCEKKLRADEDAILAKVAELKKAAKSDN